MANKTWLIMETFREYKNLIENPDFHLQRSRSLTQMENESIDPPIADLVNDFAKLPYCFTLQSCYGHFLYDNQRNIHDIARLPVSGAIDEINYRIAYVAFCIENSRKGIELLRDLERVPIICPDYIQFGCAEWFWKRQVNSYVLQVEPTRFKNLDTCFIGYEEAMEVQHIRDIFWITLDNILRRHLAAME